RYTRPVTAQPRHSPDPPRPRAARTAQRREAWITATAVTGLWTVYARSLHPGGWLLERGDHPDDRRQRRRGRPVTTRLADAAVVIADRCPRLQRPRIGCASRRRRRRRQR